MNRDQKKYDNIVQTIIINGISMLDQTYLRGVQKGLPDNTTFKKPFLSI